MTVQLFLRLGLLLFLGQQGNICSFYRVIFYVVVVNTLLKCLLYKAEKFAGQVGGFQSGLVLYSSDPGAAMLC